jgi:hypothetical protein
MFEKLFGRAEQEVSYDSKELKGLSNTKEQILARKQIEFEELLGSKGIGPEVYGSFPTEKIKKLILDQIKEELKSREADGEYCDQLEATKADLENGKVKTPQDLLGILKGITIENRLGTQNMILKWAKEISE